MSSSEPGLRCSFYDNHLNKRKRVLVQLQVLATDQTGYFPGVATINDKIVYIENRDGNANVKISQHETLERAYELIEENEIMINRSRMDAGSYSKDIIDTVSRHSRLFYIRANKSESMFEQIGQISDWKKASEKLFDIQNNDFGWGRLPTSEMNSNTVFLILTAMMKNFYNHIIKKVSEVFTDIPIVSRMKRFIFRFICVAGKWVRQSRQWKLRLYTERPYEKLVAS